MNIVIAMRGHGNIISFGQGTRCVAYGDHQKVKFFSEECGTPWISSSCNSDDLFKEMFALSTDERFDRNLHTKLTALNQSIDDFNHKVLQQIKG